MGEERTPDLLTKSTPYFLPAEPLGRVEDSLTRKGFEVEEFITRSQRDDLARMRNKGWIQYLTGDEIACAFGYHPFQVWGDAWLRPHLIVSNDWKYCEYGHEYTFETMLRRKTPSGVLRIKCLDCEIEKEEKKAA